MDPQQEAKTTTPPTPIDTQFQQFQPTDVAGFQPRTDAVISPTHHIPSQLPMYPSDFASADSMALSMQMSAVDPMDLANPSLSDHLASSALLSNFPQQSGPSFMPDPPMSGIENHEPGHHMLSSPTTTTTSTNPSHVSSPALNSMVPAYVMGSSSLASALDGSRSRSGSAASPGHPTGGDLSFPSSNSGPPTSAHEPNFPFPPGFEQGFSVSQSKESSPDASDPHLMVLGDMLKNIAKTASSGSEAFSNGQTTSAASIVDQLTKNVLLVAQMVATMQLRDQNSGSPPSVGSPHAQTGAATTASHSSPPVRLGLDSTQAQQHLNGLPGFDASAESSSSLDAPDMSRKRCASTNDGDRISKAMKMEPQDDFSLQMPPPPHMNTSPSFSFANPSIPPTMATIAEHPNIPAVPSLPATRPPSSSGHSMKLMQDMQSTPSSMHFPGRLEFAPQLSQDFSTLPSGPATAPAPLSTSFSSAALTNSWPESRPTVSRHSHSLSGAGSSLTGIPHPLATNLAYTPSSSAFHSPTHPTIPSQAALPSAMPPLSVGRMSRSSSMSQSNPNPFAFGIDQVPANPFDPHPQSRPPTSGGLHTRAGSPEWDDDDGDDSDDEHPLTARNVYQTHTPPSQSGGMDEKERHSASSSAGPSTRRGSRTSPSAEGGSASHGNEVPAEYKAEVERIFFDFLNKTCSNLDAADAKGEPIHQTLMAKKMQRLDESPDFRPFKFRIQAFTNAFLEELARQGYPEEKIPMKKIRNFLWNQPYISRFNEEGKKSKSKGNHIWHVDAKKTEGGWSFRPFQRKLAGAPPGVAYIGLRWSWTPRIWDPQASRSNMPVTYTSPNLPPWLSWNDDTLSGIPPPDAESCDVTVEARFTQDGKDEMLSHTVHVNIAPMTAVDASFTPSRRPSLVGDMHNPRRVMSDSVLPQQVPQRILRAQPPLAPAIAPAPVVAPDSQVVQVLTTAAQRVAQEAQSQVVAASTSPHIDVSQAELESLAKQQHVLTVTAQAFNNKSSGEPPVGSTTQSNVLAAAAQQVVLQAARQVAADRTSATLSSGVVPSQAVTNQVQVTVKEVSVATQSAVAQAVDMIGPLSSEVDVMMTAKSLLQQQTRNTPLPPPAPLTADPAQFAASLDPTRPHSTGAMLHNIPFPSHSVVPQPPPIPTFYAHGGA
ncbi:hypothetical protein PsYK624_068530 [Phanerochaete sordida]|uniref:Uncharacterized protein n=1 Tax=Phanerochaete sordida TaxID=48140 RepID=A0A9P3GBA4_9APHY|nr:hypothetical protein PsYK624_068530 [Phanerochaete sordida]